MFRKHRFININQNNSTLYFLLLPFFLKEKGVDLTKMFVKHLLSYLVIRSQ